MTAPQLDRDASLGGLDERERQVLAFEHRRFLLPGVKEQAIHDLFGLSVARYYQLLNELIERPEAQQVEPMLVNRLLRLREARRRDAGRIRSGRR